MIKKLGKEMLMGTLLIGLVLGSGQPVFAQSNESEDVVEETEEEPFTPDGNAQLVDEATDKDGKLFYTFATKNNQYFYLVIDKERDTENVYMLNLIDEQDLMALIDEQEETGSFLGNKDNEINLKPEAEETEEKADDPEPVEQPERKTDGVAILLFCVLVGGAVVAVAYYLKFVRGKESDFEEEDMDFDDEDEEYCTDEEDTVDLMDTEDSKN